MDTTTDIEAAVNKAEALDCLDFALKRCIDVGLDEIQLRHAICLVVDDVGGRLVCDPLLSRELGFDGYEWHVRA
jgi:hypothetical protein